MLRLKLKQKIILFWLSSIIISIFLLGGVFYLLQENLQQQNNQQKLNDAFNLLGKDIQNRHQRLQKNTAFVVKQKNVISSLSMLHHYQDINNYQNIIFDPEKKKLNQELIKLLKTTSATLIAAYDGHYRLNSFVYTDSDKNIQTAYLSYIDNKATIMGASEHDSEFDIITDLPQQIHAGLHVHEYEHGTATTDGNTYINIHEQNIVLEAHIPVIRKLANGKDLKVGIITVIDLLDTGFVKKIRSLTGLDISISFDRSNWLSSTDNNFNSKLSSLPIWENLTTGLANWKLVLDKQTSFGVAEYATPNSDTKIHIAFIPLKDDKLAAFPLLKEALIVVLLFNLLLLLPIGIFFLRKNVLTPISQLVHGVESLGKGQYEELSTIKGGGELTFLTNSFNKMAGSIHQREKELIKLSLAVEQSPISMLITDTHGNIEYVNTAFCKIYGYSKNEIIGKSTSILKGGESSKKTYRQLWSTITKGKEWRGVFHNKTKAGNMIWGSVTILPIKSADGDIINYLALNEDITQIKKDKEQLDLQAAALQATADGILITDTNGTIQWVNPAYEKLTGYSFQDVVGKNPRILKSGKQDNSYYSDLWDTILAGKSWHKELYNKRKDGIVYLEEQSITPVFDKDNNITNFVAVKRDITKQRKQEIELQQSQKMDALGKLTGGVAHDYNNMLGIIIGYSELLQHKLTDNPELLKFATIIQRAGERGSSLTKKLLTFSRQKTSDFNFVNINSLIRDNQLMLEKSLTARIKISYHFDDDLCDVFMNGNDFNDAILNMCINSMHAMPSGGQIIMTTNNIYLDAIDANFLDLKEGNYALLTIKDTGIGMDLVTQGQIFEPFFSTKGDKGTGLGLSQVYGFVKSANGTITVDSQVGEGSQFNIYIPCNSDLDNKTNAEPGYTEQVPAGSEIILVVDDETELGELTSEILREHGYKVLLANSAKQALEILNKQSVDLVLTDVIMPEMDGYVLALEIKDLYPDTKIQHVSGYNDIDDSDLKKHGFPETLKKPLDANDMLKRINKLLNNDK